MTELINAVKAGKVKLCRRLIRRGADVNRPDKDGRTPLYWAALYRYPNITRLLIKAKADVNIKDKNREGPLEAIAKYYVRRRCAWNIIKLLAKKVDIKNEGEESLVSASINEDLETVRLLLKYGVDPGAKVGSGITPLMFAAWNGNIKIVKTLIEAGANVNDRDNPKGNYYQTPLMYAVESGCDKTLRILIEAGADVNAKQKGGITPLMLVNIKKNPKITKKLHLRLFSNRKEYLKLLKEKSRSTRMLLYYGADVHAKDNAGKTAVNYAIKCGNPEIARVLLRAGARISADESFMLGSLFMLIYSVKAR